MYLKCDVVQAAIKELFGSRQNRGKKKRASKGEEGAFLFAEAIPFSRGYYVMLDVIPFK